jgi:hypothetical protein
VPCVGWDIAQRSEQLLSVGAMKVGQRSGACLCCVALCLESHPTVPR